jgi:hypothetical protein
MTLSKGSESKEGNSRMVAHHLPWRDSEQVRSQLEFQFTETELVKIYSLYSLHYFMYGALPTKSCSFESKFETSYQFQSMDKI